MDSDSLAGGIYQQTIRVAIHRDTGEHVTAPSLLTMDDDTFHGLRRAAAASFDSSSELPLLRCAICEVGLRVQPNEQGNRYFVHAEESPRCPWYQGSNEHQLAAGFLFQKEDQRHYQFRNLLVAALNADPDIGRTAVAQVPFWSGITKGTWRRPDVRCTWRGRPVVFEIQLGYTYLGEVIKRDAFYQAEGVDVIWVFASLDPTDQIHRDEHYFNRRNLFAFDEAAHAKSASEQRLVLTCRFDRPTVERNGTIATSPEAALVGLSDLTYDAQPSRPFYFDYYAARQEAEAQARELLRQIEEARRRAAEVAARTHLRTSGGPPRANNPTSPSVKSDDRALAVRVYKACLDQYQNDAGHLRERLRTLAGPALDFPDAADRDIATRSIDSPYFELLLFARGLELAKPYARGAISLAEWVNREMNNIETRQPQLAVMYVMAWYAYPPNQAANQHKHLLGIYDHVVASLRGGQNTYKPENRLAQFISTLFPRIEAAIRDSGVLPHIAH